MPQLRVRINSSQQAFLDAVAKKAEMTKSELVRTLIAQFQLESATGFRTMMAKDKDYSRGVARVLQEQEKSEEED